MTTSCTILFRNRRGLFFGIIQQTFSTTPRTNRWNNVHLSDLGDGSSKEKDLLTWLQHIHSRIENEWCVESVCSLESEDIWPRVDQLKMERIEWSDSWQCNTTDHQTRSQYNRQRPPGRWYDNTDRLLINEHSIRCASEVQWFYQLTDCRRQD